MLRFAVLSGTRYGNIAKIRDALGSWQLDPPRDTFGCPELFRDQGLSMDYEYYLDIDVLYGTEMKKPR